MYALHEISERAEKEGVAIDHFNVADLVQLKAVFASAPELILVEGEIGDTAPVLKYTKRRPTFEGIHHAPRSCRPSEIDEASRLLAP